MSVFTKSLNWLKNERFKVLIFLVSAFFPLVSILLLSFTKDSFPVAVPLWFSRPWGLERLAAPAFLWILPLVSFLILIINFFLANYLFLREKILSNILFGSSPLISFLLFFTLLQIVLLAS